MKHLLSPPSKHNNANNAHYSHTAKYNHSSIDFEIPPQLASRSHLYYFLTDLLTCCWSNSVWVLQEAHRHNQLDKYINRLLLIQTEVSTRLERCENVSICHVCLSSISLVAPCLPSPSVPLLSGRAPSPTLSPLYFCIQSNCISRRWLDSDMMLTAGQSNWIIHFMEKSLILSPVLKTDLKKKNLSIWASQAWWPLPTSTPS